MATPDHMCSTSAPDSTSSAYFRSASLYGQPFSSYMVFETSFKMPYDIKMSMQAMRTKVPRVSSTNTAKSQMSNLFVLRLPDLSYRPFLDKCTEWPQNTEKLIIHIHIYVHVLIRPDSNFNLFRSTITHSPNNRLKAFGFPKLYNKIFENRKLKISNIQNCTFRRTINNKFQGTLGRI